VPAGPGQVMVHDSVGELRRDALPGDQYPVVDGADELVDREIDVGGLGQLTAAACPEERPAFPVALAGQELGLQAGRDGRAATAGPRRPGRDGRAVLCLPGRGPEYGAFVCPAQERGELAQLIAKVAAEVSVVGRGEVLGRVGGEGVEQDVGPGGTCSTASWARCCPPGRPWHFVGSAELAVGLVARARPAHGTPAPLPQAGQDTALAAYRASVAAGDPLSARQLAARRGVSRRQAGQVVTTVGQESIPANQSGGSAT
jgi:hypothetical protein